MKWLRIDATEIKRKVIHRQITLKAESLTLGCKYPSCPRHAKMTTRVNVVTLELTQTRGEYLLECGRKMGVLSRKY